MFCFALVHCFEIIGEAAANVTPALRERMPRVPWPQIVAMRNRLAHAYFDINLARVWDTLTLDLPPLVEAVEKALKEVEE